MSVVYEVATRLTMIDGVSGVLAGIARGVGGLNVSLTGLERQLNGLNRGALLAVGSLSAIGGVAMLAGFKSLADHGDKLLDQQFKLRNLGVQQNEILKLQADYYRNIAKAVPTSTADEYLKTVRELRAITGPGAAGLAAAAKMAPQAMMMNELLGNEMGTKSGDEYYKLLRSSEMKGIATDPAKREAFINEAYKYIAGFGGKLTANDYQVLARRGGAAWMNAKPESLGAISVLAADLGGSGAGTTLMTLQQMQMGAGVLSKQQGEVLQQLDLLDMSKVTKTGFGGGKLQVGPGGIKGSLEHTGDLPGWIQEVVYPALVKAAGGDENKLESLLAKIAPNRNASKLIHMFGAEGFRDQIAKDLGISKDVLKLEKGYGDYVKNDPVGVKKAFHAQYESMMQAIGAPAMQAALPVMKAVTDLFTKIGNFANSNPRLFENLAKGMAELGSAAIVGGLGLMVGGPAGGLIGALAGGLGALAALNWTGLSTAIAGVTADFQKLIAGFQDFGTKLLDWLNGLLWKLSNWIGNAWHAISKWLPSSWVGGAAAAGYTGPAIPRSGSEAEHLADAKAYAASKGLNADVVARVMGAEGLHGYVGDHGSSFGDFQLHKGGMAGGGNRFSGLGDLYERQTGHRLRDPSDWRFQNHWAIDHIAKTNDLRPWHGWKGHPGAARSGPPPRPERHARLPDVNLQINGRTFAKLLGSELARLGEHSRQAPYAGRGQFMGPDHQFAAG